MKRTPARNQIALSFISVLAGFAIAIVAAPAHAGIYLESTFFPSYSQTNMTLSQLGGALGGEAVAPESGFNFELRNTLGYSFMGVFLGASYNYASSPLSSKVTADFPSVKVKMTGWEWGPSLGFMMNNFRLIGTYYISGAKSLTDKRVMTDGTVTSDFNQKNSGCKGYEIKIGYDFNLLPTLKIGPSLSYRHATYAKQTLDNKLDPAANHTNLAFTTKPVESDLKPMISLVFDF